MCIRDRLGVAHAGRLHLLSQDDGQVDRGAFGGPFLIKAGPVSYTHLRAHETVLDLVCRLLLEKKKKTNKIAHVHTYAINLPNQPIINRHSKHSNIPRKYMNT